MFCGLRKKQVAILCEFDYIKSSPMELLNFLHIMVAILCEFDYIKSRFERLFALFNHFQVAILCEFDYIKSTWS